ncbi:selenium cofactor biosynthesis protein YqeC [Thermodesulfobacteriota bacterium]
MADIQDILPLKSGGILSITGAGGKTSLMFHLAAILGGIGKKVLTTTTTKIFPPFPEQSKTMIISDSIEEFLDRAAVYLKKDNHITAAASRIRRVNKLKGFSPELIHDIHKEKLFDWILVEADGAAQRSLKASSDHEPVIPVKSDILLGVAGLDVIGKSLNESNVFRSELFSQRIGLPLGEIISEPHLAALIAHPMGMLKGAPPEAECFVFLNKADNKKMLESGRKIVDQLHQMESCRPGCVIIGEAKERMTVHECLYF